MGAFIRFVERRAWFILAIGVALTVAAGFRLPELRYEDDVTAFLPEGDPEVTRFWKVGELFGGLNIALVGLEVAEPEGDLFTTERLEKLVRLSKVLYRVDGVSAVSGLPTVRDFRHQYVETGERQSVVEDLIPEVPKDAEGLDALRKRTLAAAHLVGSLVSADGRATVLLCQLDDKQSALHTAIAMREAAQEVDVEAAGLHLHLGGAPFINEGLATAAEDDFRSLGPIIGIVIVLIVLLSFRSISATLLSILPVGLAIVLTMGFMAALGEPLTLVSSSLPIVLLALGSAYPVHVIARCLAVAHERGTNDRETLRVALRRVAPPVLGAGLTTLFGFLSFQAMDIWPMRSFGVFMAAGVAISTAIALALVPAVLFLLGRCPSPPSKGVARRSIAWLHKAFEVVERRATIVFVVTGLLAAVFAFGAVLIRTEMSTAAYFNRETPAVRADQFLRDKFGGSLFLQLLVEANVRDPLVLEEMARLEDFARSTDGVSDVRSVTEVVQLASKGLFEVDALPRRPDQVENLVALAEDDPAIRLLVTKNWDAALIQLRLGGFDTELAGRIMRGVGGYIDENLAAPLAAVAWRSPDTPPATRTAILKRAAADLETVLYDESEGEGPRHEKIVAALDRGLGADAYLRDEAFRERVRSQLHRDLVDDELIYLEGGEEALPALIDAILQTMAQSPLSMEQVDAMLLARAEQEERSDELAARKEGRDNTGFRRAAGKVFRSLRDLQDGVAVTSMVASIRDATVDAPGWDVATRAARVARIARALTDDQAFAPLPIVQATGATPLRETTVKVAASGYPVLWDGMNTSVRLNQVKSVGISAVLIFIVLALLFRSALAAIAIMLPTGFTILISFGALGFAGVPIDMGSAMISSIALGVGIDYAIHYFWSYRAHLQQGPEAADRSATEVTAPAIVVNALEVGLAFGLLMFGTVAPMARFGILTGGTMLLAAAATLLLLPLLIRRVGNRQRTLPTSSAAPQADEPSPQA